MRNDRRDTVNWSHHTPYIAGAFGVAFLLLGAELALLAARVRRARQRR